MTFEKEHVWNGSSGGMVDKNQPEVSWVRYLRYLAVGGYLVISVQPYSTYVILPRTLPKDQRYRGHERPLWTSCWQQLGAKSWVWEYLIFELS